MKVFFVRSSSTSKAGSPRLFLSPLTLVTGLYLGATRVEVPMDLASALPPIFRTGPIFFPNSREARSSLAQKALMSACGDSMVV